MNKRPFSMLMEPKLWTQLSKQSKKTNMSKVKIVSLALNKLFKSGELDVLTN